MADQKIIEKIKKLLELAGSPNENEAKLAMHRATDLMEKYSVDFCGEKPVAESVIERKIYVIPIKPHAGLDPMTQVLLGVIPPLFGARGLMMMKGSMFESLISGQASVYQYEILGWAENIKVTEFCLNSLYFQAELDYQKAMKSRRGSISMFGFWGGFAKAIHSRFAEDFTRCKGLTVYDPIQAYLDKLAPVKGGPINFMNPAGALEGYNAGMEAKIRKDLIFKNKGNLLE